MILAQIVVEPFDGLSSLINSWQFTLEELAGTHLAAVCVESDGSRGGEIMFYVGLHYDNDSCLEST